MVRLVYAWAATVAAALQRAPRPRLGSAARAVVAAGRLDRGAPPAGDAEAATSSSPAPAQPMQEAAGAEAPAQALPGGWSGLTRV